MFLIQCNLLKVLSADSITLLVTLATPDTVACSCTEGFHVQVSRRRLIQIPTALKLSFSKRKLSQVGFVQTATCTQCIVLPLISRF